MGLAATKNKQKLGLDPRNTAWSNDTSRFGHKHMEKMGWTPGSGLGMMPNATTTHVKVSIKDDNLGLGAKLRKKDKADEFDSGECAGLDAFQRLLGRLNGKEDKVSNELDIQKKENIINGKWGINFVKGDVLASTWDAKTKTLRLYSNDAAKRKQDSDDSDEEPKSKRAKKSKERSSDKADQEKKKSKKEKKLKKDKKGKKDKRDKKEKDEKKDKKDKSTHKKDKLGDTEKDSKHKRGSKDKKEKKEKKSKKDVKEKKDKSGARNSEVSRESMLKPKAAQDDAIASRLSIRSKWIKQKRAAVMDAKALNEIFMISS